MPPTLLLRYLEGAAAAISWFFTALLISQYYNTILFNPNSDFIISVKIVGVFSIAVFLAIAWHRGLEQFVILFGLDVFLYIGALLFALSMISLEAAPEAGGVGAGASFLSFGLYALCVTYRPVIAREKLRRRTPPPSVLGDAMTGSLRLIGVFYALWLVFDPQGMQRVLHEMAVGAAARPDNEWAILTTQHLENWVSPAGVHFFGWLIFGLLVRSLYLTAEKMGRGDALAGLRRWAVAFGIFIVGFAMILCICGALDSSYSNQWRIGFAVAAIIAAGITYLAVRTYRADRARGSDLHADTWL